MSSEISSASLLCRDTRSLAQLILDIAADYIEAQRGSVMLVDETGHLRIIASKGLEPRVLTDFRCRSGEGIAGRLLAECMPAIVKDIETDKRFRRKKGASYRTKSFMSHPIACNRSLRGIINLSEKCNAPFFEEEDMKLLAIVAGQSSVALENAVLLNGMRSKASEFEAMNERMMQSDLAKTEFLLRASHDLRTPLNSVKGAVYCLKTSSHMSRAEQEEFINIIANEAERLGAKVEELLLPFGSARPKNGVDEVPINLESQIANLMSMPNLRQRLSNRDISVSLESKGLPMHIVGDRMRVLNLLYNLMDGLSAHAESGSTIRVRLHENDHIQLDLTLSTGLPKAAADCLLNPAPSIEAVEPHEQIGLALARQIAHKHQWTIKVNDTGSGTCVTVLIPKQAKVKRDAFISMAMSLFLDLISEILCANRSSIMIVERPANQLRIVSSRGIQTDVIQSVTVKVGEGISGGVAVRGTPLFVEDVESDRPLGWQSLRRYTTGSFICVPILVRGLPIAVVNLTNRQDGRAFTATDRSIASALCDRFSRCLENLYTPAYEDLECEDLISCLERLASAAGSYHKRGSLIPELTARLFETLSCDEQVRNEAVYASALYDLGLVLLGDAVFKEAELTPAGHRIIAAHPLSTISVLEPFELSDSIRRGILHHHERFDGSGYPDGLRGEEIPLLSRGLAVVDSYTAMLCDRPHRRALSKDEALARIREGAETLYDPLLVAALERAVALAA